MVNTFITTCNLGRFDLIEHFNSDTYVVWKDISKCRIDDIVYVYVGRPYSQLMYKCRVIEKNCDVSNCNYIELNVQKKKEFMKLELMSELSTKIPLNELLEHGLKTVQCSTQAAEQLIDFINEVE